MVRFRFKRGLRFFEGTRRWSLEKLNAVGMLVFESQDEACERRSMSPQEVHLAWLKGTWVIDVESLGPGEDVAWHTTPPDLKSLDSAQQARATIRMKVLMAVKSHFDSVGKRVVCEPKALESIAKRASEFGLTKIPHWTTVWRWWLKFARTQCATRLANVVRRGRKIDSDQFALFQEVVDEFYLHDQKLPAKTVVDEIHRRYDSLNHGRPEREQLRPPSPATVYRWLNKLEYSVVSAARNGKDYHHKERRRVTGTVTARRILDRYEIDHTPVDVLLVCEQTWMVLGRPWLTLIVDRRSRMIAGFYIGFHAPSATSVLYALRQAILPKDAVLATFPTKNPWPVRGCPMALVLDNGMDLHATSVEEFCLETQIEMRFMGAGKPELKGAVERLFGTLSRDLFHTLPGTVFGNVDDRGDYPSEDRAALTLHTFTEVLIRWIVDVYHCTPHRGLKGGTPLAVWEVDQPTAVISLPAFPKQMDLMVGHAATRSLFHYGIDCDCVRYSSTQLLAMRDPKATTQLLAIKCYDDEVGYIDVCDPATGEYLRVPAIDQDYARGLNRHAHALIRAEARKRFGDKETRVQLLAVKAEIQALVKAAIRAKKTGTRKKAAALRNHNSEVALGTRPADALLIAQTPMIDNEPEIALLHDLDEPLPQYASLPARGAR